MKCNYLQHLTTLMPLILNNCNNITIIYLTICNINSTNLLPIHFLYISKYLTFTMLVNNIDIFNI